MEERRQHRRARLVAHVAGRVLPSDAALRVMELGAGGMLIVLDECLPPGGLHEFRLRLAGSSGGEAVVRGHVVHGRFEVEWGTARWTLGVRFTDVPNRAAAMIRQAVARADDE